jgi:hypothetical protein
MAGEAWPRRTGPALLPAAAAAAATVSYVPAARPRPCTCGRAASCKVWRAMQQASCLLQSGLAQYVRSVLGVARGGLGVLSDVLPPAPHKLHSVSGATRIAKHSVPAPHRALSHSTESQPPAVASCRRQLGPCLRLPLSPRACASCRARHSATSPRPPSAARRASASASLTSPTSRSRSAAHCPSARPRRTGPALPLADAAATSADAPDGASACGPVPVGSASPRSMGAAAAIAARLRGVRCCGCGCGCGCGCRSSCCCS